MNSRIAILSLALAALAGGAVEAPGQAPPTEVTLEQALEFIGDGELVEVTPKNIRIRKEKLLEHERRTAERLAKKNL